MLSGFERGWIPGQQLWSDCVDKIVVNAFCTVEIVISNDAVARVSKEVSMEEVERLRESRGDGVVWNLRSTSMLSCKLEEKIKESEELFPFNE